VGGGFFHIGPLKPVDIPQSRWASHPLLRMADMRDDGLDVDWHLGEVSDLLRAFQLHELDRIIFRRDDDGPWIAQVPPRLNDDWFVTAHTDEQAPAPGDLRGLTFRPSFAAVVDRSDTARATKDVGCRRP